MNKKGFTLVELLAVIVILGVVATIATVSISSIQRKTNLSMLAEKADFIASAGITYYEDDETRDTNKITPNEYLKAATTYGCVVTGKYLISKGALETGETDSSGNAVIRNTITKEDISGLTVYVYMKYNRIYSCIPQTSTNTALLADLEDSGVDTSFYCQGDSNTGGVYLAQGYTDSTKMKCG